MNKLSMHKEENFHEQKKYDKKNGPGLSNYLCLQPWTKN